MTISDYEMPVHKCFFQPDMIAGVKKAVFFALIAITVVIGYIFKIAVGLACSVVLYIPCRILTARDPEMLSIAMASLLEPDHLEG